MSDSRVGEWMEEYGWARNPFTFRIYPDLMIGYEDAHQRIRNSIESGNKFTLLLGDTGAGKTNLLRTIEQEYGETHPLFYMSKPPVTEDGLLSYLREEVVQPGWLSRMLHSYSLYNIHEPLNDRFDDSLILLVDEGHEASVEVLEWIRTALDHVDSLTVIAAGLPQFQEKLQQEVNTLHNRATEVVQLESLGRDSTIELVRRRIEYVGGTSTDPFTQSALLAVYEETGGFPREVLRVCNDCVIAAAAEGKSIIDETDVSDVIDDSEAAPARRDESTDEVNSPEEGAASEAGASPEIARLTEKQRSVVDAVEVLGEATSGEIVDEMGTEEYKSRSHAIRSINNILRRLMEQDVLTRQRQGRNYIYSVAE